jgi:hypothetical protein
VIVKSKKYIALKDVEYKPRERIILKEVSSKGVELPDVKTKNALQWN